MPGNDTTVRFSADISDLRASMQEAARLARLASSEFKNASAGMGRWSTSADGLRAKLTQLNKQEQIQKRVLDALQREYDKVAKAEGEDSKGAQLLKIKLNEQSAQVKKTQSDMAHYESELDKVEKGEKDVGKAAKTAGDQVKGASDGFTVAKGVLSNLVTMGIRKAIDGFRDLAREVYNAGTSFESAMSQVEAISGASGDALDALTEKAKEMGSKTKFSATESAQAFNYMAMAGWETGDMLNGIEGVMALAAASGEDLAQTSDIVTDALTAMGYAAGDAGHLADVMAAASANSNTNVGLMGKTFQYAAPLVGSLGFNMEDTAVAIGMMANAGIKGSKAGTSLRKILSNLATPSKETAAAMERLNISMTDDDGKMKDMQTILKDLRKAFSGLGDAEKAAEAKHIAGQNAMSGLLAIVNGADADFNKLTEAVYGSKGAAEEMAATMNDNVAGQITLLKSQIEGIMITVFEKLAPTLRDAIGEVSDALQNVDWESEAKKVQTFAGYLLDVFKWILQNGRAVATVLGTIGALLATMFVTNKIATFVRSIMTFTTAMNAAKVATEGATVATKALAIAQMAMPWAALAAGIGAAVAALVIYNKAHEKAIREEYELTREQKESIKAIEESKQAYDDLTDARKKSISGITSEYGYLEDLVDDYNSLIDENGKVKKGYQDRADFILTTLANALGLEQDEVQKLIDKNGQLSDSIDELIRKKQAEATLAAGEDAYKTAIENRSTALKQWQDAQATAAEAETKYKQTQEDAAEALRIYQGLLDAGQKDAAAQYKSINADLFNANDEAKKSFEEAQKAVKDAENVYVGYNSTIRNYEGLSSAIISGDQKKIGKALTKMQNDFVSAKDGTRDTLEEQLRAYEENLAAIEQAIADGTPGVTEEQRKQAKKLVKAAKKELDKLPPEAGEAGTEAGADFAKGTGSQTKQAAAEGRKLRQQTSKALDDKGEAGKKGQKQGADYAQGVGSAKGKAHTEGAALSSNAVSGVKENNDSAETLGSNFGSGYVSGIGSWLKRAWNKGYELTSNAVKGGKEGQKSSSPSKLTYQTGVWFVEGYINGIASQEAALVKMVKDLAGTAVTTLTKVSAYDFSAAGEAAKSQVSDTMSKQIAYVTARANYENEQKIAEFDKEISGLQKKQKKAAKDLQKQSDKDVAKIEKERDTKVKALQKKLDATKDKDAKKNLQNQIKDIKEKAKKRIDAEKKSVKKEIEASNKSYDKLIRKQEQLKDSYTEASGAMLQEFNDAMNAYQTAAQQLIDDTIGGITDKYTQRYDELIDKQSTLVDKLKNAGELFEISGAGVMTVSDLKAQTKAITDYTNKLAKIKGKVSAELFDQIASYDMTEGSAFMDRLLEMSAADLAAYNKAYTAKMQAAQKAGDTIYKKDIEQVAKDYDTEIKKAMKDLPAQLGALGTQAMKGFVDGLTKNTDYMSKSVQTWVKSMVATFKKELKIKSPSKVMMEIGGYTGEGFAEGLADSFTSLRDAVRDMTGIVATPIDMSASIGGLRSAVGYGSTSNTTVVNNYNLVQNNTSPRSLSALDTYRARRQQVAQLKALTT